MQRFGSYILTALTVVLLCCMAIQPALTQSTATIATSQKMYSVGEGMVVNGTGFTAGASINLTVQRPDQVVDSITGVFADSTGKFTANYAPPQEPGRYRFTATDGVNTAKTAITSADAIGYNKGVYNKGDTTYSGGGSASGSNWTSGNAGSNYLEGQWAFYQYEITGVGTTIPDADIAFNHFQSNTNAIFVDGFANIRACFDCTDNTFTSGPSQGMLTDANFAPPTGTTNWVDAHTGMEKINHPFDSATNTCLATNDTPATVYQFHCMHLNGGTMKSLINAGLNSKNSTSGVDYFATGTHTVTIYYAAHLAATATWTKGFEYLVGCSSDAHFIKGSGQGAEFIPANTVFGTDDYNPTAGPCGTDSASWTTTQFFGIGSATGSSRHFELQNQTLGSNGGIDLPIPSVPAPTGSITIVKVTVPTPATGATFSFSGDLGTFNLDTDPGTTTPSSQTFSGLSGGTTYNVGETSLPSGWQNSNIACVNNTGTSTFTYSQNTSGGSVAIGLANTSGAAVTCTFTNTGSATLKLVKLVSNTHGGTATASSWTTSASGPTPISGAGGVGPSQVNPGTYTLSESGTVAGYTNGTTYSCVNNNGTPVTENSITLAPGDNAVCTITNSDNPASLTLVKTVQNTNGGTATASSWTLSASGPTPISGAGGVGPSNVSAGTYTLSESGTVTGYTNGTTYSCVKNGGSAVSGNSVTLAVGDSATCTIINHDNPAHLQLVKQVNNNNGGTATASSWTLSAAGPTPLSGAGGVANTAVSAGTYTLSESGSVTGYTNGTTYSCVKNGGSAVSGNSVTLAVGDSAVCTIINSDSPAHLQLVKTVQNDNGGTATASSWTLSASGPTPLSGAGGVANTAVNAGTYTLSESGTVAGYTNGTTYSCVKNGGSAVSGNSVTLGVGDSAVCTIINHDNPAHLALVKNVVNTNGGTATASSWTLSAAGTTPLSGAGGVASSPVSAGTYTLSESGSVFGYTNGTTYSCVKNGGSAVSGNSISLVVGDSATCTITNHDNPASLQLVKNVVNTNGGTATASSWTLSASGNTPISGAGGVGPSNVSAGTYTLSESGTVAGYTNGTTYSCVKNGGSAVSGNSVTLGVGDSAVCTISNHDNPAHLQLVKQVNNNNGGTATASSWTLSAGGPTPLSGAGGVANTAVNAGTYTLSESGTVAGYTNGTTYSCVKNGGSAVSGNSVTLAVGDSAVCTIINSDSPAHLQLVKNVVNTNGGTATASSWTLSAAGPTPLSGAGGTANTAVNAGTYTLSESGTVAGYTNGTTYSCSTNGGAAVSSNSITLGVGDSGVCTISNHDNPAHLQLIKSVSNTNGGTATASSWTLAADGPTPLSGAGGVANTAVSAGTYSLSESGSVFGYTNGTTYSCVKNGGSAVSGNSIVLSVGDSAVCTIINSDSPAHLALVKNVVNSYGGTATASSWTLSASGNTPLSGAGGVVSTAVAAGTYNLSESGTVAGYTNGTTYSCVKNGGSAVSGNSIVLGVGDSATCTISNHDNPATIVLRKNTVGGNGSFGFTATGNGLSNTSITTLGGTGSQTYSNLSGNSAGGSRSFAELVPAGWIGTGSSCAVTVAGDGLSSMGTATTGTVAAGGTMTTNITNLGMGATVTCTFTNDLLPTLSIVKTIQGTGTATFTFPVTGANALNPTITPPAAPSQASFGPVTINVGASTISEATPPTGWTLTDAVCTGASGGVVNGTLDTNGVPTSITFTAGFGDNVICSYVNNNAKASRTQGFWATHTALSDNIWNGTNLPSGATAVAGTADATLCGFPITAVAANEENVLMGGFWSNISKTSKSTARTAIDKARMQMLQQYLAAVLNYHMFGSIGEGTLATARTAYCGTNATAIQNYIGILGNLNQAGDQLGTTPGGSATAQTSKKYADIDAWDIPQFPELSDEDAGTAPHLSTVKNLANGLSGTAVPTNFTLKAACSAGACGTTSYSGAGGFASTTVSKGVYTLTDTASSTTTGYTPGSWACTGTGSFFVGSTTSGKATVALGYGATVSCSITNTHP